MQSQAVKNFVRKVKEVKSVHKMYHFEKVKILVPGILAWKVKKVEILYMEIIKSNFPTKYKSKKPKIFQ